MINVVPEDFGTVVIVLHRVLHKTEAVDITHIRVSIGSEKIEAAHSLLQREQDTCVSLMSIHYNEGTSKLGQTRLHKVNAFAYLER